MNQVTGYQQHLMLGSTMGTLMEGETAPVATTRGVQVFTVQQPYVLHDMGTGSRNNDITQLMNPMSLDACHRNKEGKSIDIDAFADLSC